MGKGTPCVSSQARAVWFRRGRPKAGEVLVGDGRLTGPPMARRPVSGCHCKCLVPDVVRIEALAHLVRKSILAGLRAYRIWNALKNGSAEIAFPVERVFAEGNRHHPF